MKNKLILTAIAMILTACGESSFIGLDPAKICQPTQLENGVLFTCQDGSSYTVSNGIDGLDGIDGADGLDGNNGFIVDIYDPCGKETTHDEILLLTKDGQYLAYFSGGNNSRLSLLEEGIMYRTTDGTNCRFRIENGTVIDAI